MIRKNIAEFDANGECTLLGGGRASPEHAAFHNGAAVRYKRLWPRGVKKTDLRLDAWLKDVASSATLRRWFSHDPKRWSEFQQRYFAELDTHPEACEPIRSAARHGLADFVRARNTLCVSLGAADRAMRLALEEHAPGVVLPREGAC